MFNHFPVTARLYRHAKFRRQLRQGPQRHPMGFLFIGDKSMQDGTFEMAEVALVKTLLGRVECLVNVGANTGYYCCLAMTMNKPILAFEPVHKNLQYLLRNIRINSSQAPVEVFPLAVSSQPGVVDIFGEGTAASMVKGWGGVSDQYAALVPANTLDNLVAPRLEGRKSLMLVDIEGAEKFMLDGAQKVLQLTPKPVWLVEITVGEHQPAGIKINPNLLATFSAFWSAGYQAYTADTQRRLVEPTEIEQIIATGNDTLKTHNFLFIENGKLNEYF